jgi:hypothetical protein
MKSQERLDDEQVLETTPVDRPISKVRKQSPEPHCGGIFGASTRSQSPISFHDTRAVTTNVDGRNSPGHGTTRRDVIDHSAVTSDSVRSDKSRQNSGDLSPHAQASSMPLFDFLAKDLRFSWPGGKDIVQPKFPEDLGWPPITFKGNIKIAHAIIGAAEVKAEIHGFDDTIGVKEMAYQNQTEQDIANNERDVLKSVRHNHIVAYLESCTMGKKMFILMFPLAAYDLNDLLRYPKAAQGKELVWLQKAFTCLCKTLQYLRDKHIKHKDIKPANILIERNGSVILADFGISKKYPTQEEAISKGPSLSTPRYASAEVAGEDDERGFEQDVFSLGCVYLEMTTVILGETLENLFEKVQESLGRMDGNSPAARTGAEIQAFQLCGDLGKWVNRLEASFADISPPTPPDSVYDFKRKLVKVGIPKIISMLAADKTLRPTLEDVYSTFSSFCPHDCSSCKVCTRTT